MGSRAARRRAAREADTRTPEQVIAADRATLGRMIALVEKAISDVRETEVNIAAARALAHGEDGFTRPPPSAALIQAIQNGLGEGYCRIESAST